MFREDALPLKLGASLFALCLKLIRLLCDMDKGKPDVDLAHR